MGLSRYFLRSLRVEYISPGRDALNGTIDNLKRSMRWFPSDAAHGQGGATPGVPWPIPERLPRREWRLTYLKSPFKFKFVHPASPHLALSAVLGAMRPNVECTCAFEWHFPGRQEQSLAQPPNLPAVCGEPVGGSEGCCPASASDVEAVIKEERAVEKMTRRLERRQLHWFKKSIPENHEG